MIATLCLSSASLAQNVPSENVPKIFECNGGVVADKETAIRIAEAILSPVYGEEAIREQRPYQVTLKTENGLWMERRHRRVMSVDVFTSSFFRVMVVSLRLVTAADSALCWMQ